MNPQQREAVEHTEGPLLILAGAGSGKTRVITFRIAHLMEHTGVAPDAILAVTFTNKAAAEMQERVQRLVGYGSLAQPLIATFHSFCVRLLRRDIEAGNPAKGIGYRKDFAIYDEADQQAVVKAAIRRLGLDEKQLTPRTALAHISWAKNHMLDPQEAYLNSTDPKTEKIAHVYEIYRQELRKANALDFDDLLLETVRLLKAADEVRQKWARRFEYILVDEYQDTNRPQYELLRLLSGEHHNVCAVGDEDQSIYSWRGADIRNILEFERDFPNAAIIRLEQNYRSTQTILRAASAVVAHNVKRKGKDLWTTRQGGAGIGYYEAPNGENEALFAADYVQKYLRKAGQEGEANPRAAVLYRTNFQSRLFEEAMRRYGLKYHVVGGFSFYQRAEIKDMISYLKVVLNPHDSVALLRVINTPARGIGKTTLEILERIALETGASMWTAMERALEGQLLPARALGMLDAFRAIIREARALLGEPAPGPAETPGEAALPAAEAAPDDSINFAFGFADDETAAAPPGQETSASTAPAAEQATQRPATTAELLKFLLDRIGYIKGLEEEDTPDGYARIENLKELVNAAMDSRDRGESLSEFLDHAALVSDTDQYDAGAQITLMTLHSAKGLEFPLVFLVGMEEGLFPHSRTLLAPDDIEEERRLCYVGMTRAMDALVVSRARSRRRYGSDMPQTTVASRFLEEIPGELLENVGGASRQPSVFEEYGYGRDGARSGASRAERAYSYEDEDQSVAERPRPRPGQKNGPAAPKYNSIDNIAQFFASRGKKFVRPVTPVAEPAGVTGFRPGQQVRHPKYGEGRVLRREGEGEQAKLTIQFPRFGMKKLVEKYAGLERM
ncbi:MAG: UvrD-helicase domain-containing protein [Acidobacteria bacterium]|nr:UvrD-helicase domain-containing protein [Acidobacteriota bacterium]